MKNGHSIVLRRSPSGNVSIPSEFAVYPCVTLEPWSIMEGVIIITAQRQFNVSTVRVMFNTYFTLKHVNFILLYTLYTAH